MASALTTPRWFPAACVAIVVACCAWWALRVPTLETPSVPALGHDPAAEAGTPADAGQTVDLLDVTAFDVALWTAPPPPPAPPPRPAAPSRSPPPQFTLVGIVSERTGSLDDGLIAVLYDPSEDTLRMVRSGEVIGSHTVKRISADEVVVASGGREHSFALDDDRLQWRPPAEVGG